MLPFFFTFFLLCRVMTVSKHISTKRQVRLKRLIYRACYTGMKETDILLGRFAMHHLPQLEESALDEFESLLAAGDANILAWVQGKKDIPEALNGDVFARIKLCHADYLND